MKNRTPKEDWARDRMLLKWFGRVIVLIVILQIIWLLV